MTRLGSAGRHIATTVASFALAMLALSGIPAANAGHEALPSGALLPDLEIYTWPLMGTTGSSDGDDDLFRVSSVKRGRKNSQKHLRFDNEVVNNPDGDTVLRGPLEIYPDSQGCGSENQRLAIQRIYLDNSAHTVSAGFFDRLNDTAYYDHAAGCMVFHTKHQHWHFDAFARYFLYQCEPVTAETDCVRTGTALRDSAKTTFCVADVWRRNATLPGSPANDHYGADCGRSSSQGLSIGWGDEYPKTVQGQSFDITSTAQVPDNTWYCFVTQADPENKLIESDETNNEASAALKVSGTTVIERLDDAC